MSEVLETAMLLCFGASWPFNVIKSLRARSAKGKSLTFLCLILIGYVMGIIGKLVNPSYMSNLSAKWYVLVVYIINFVMVFIDFCLYFRNRRLDEQ